MTMILVISMLSCGGNDDIITPKSPVVNAITTEPIPAGSELIITGEYLDENSAIILNGEAITPTSITSSTITITIPENASSGTLEIEFQQEAYNTEAFLKILDTDWSVYGASNYFQVEFVSNDVGYAKRREADMHIIDKTMDGGNTWFSILEVPVPSSPMEVASSNVAYIRTTSNTLKKTVDGGLSWQDSELLDLSYLVEKLFFKNELEGFILTQKLDESSIFKTVDGGVTWTEILVLDTPTHNIEVVYQNEDVILLLDRMNNEFITTENAGENWLISDANISTTGPITFDFTNQNEAWLYVSPLIDNPGGLFKTDNQGQTWENLDIPELSESIIKITILDELRGHVLTDKGGSLYTNDGGETWALFYLETDDVSAATSLGSTLHVVSGGELLKKTIL